MQGPDIEKTAISTPWGLYEWVVMLQGAGMQPIRLLRRQQRCLNVALHNLIPSKKPSAARYPWSAWVFVPLGSFPGQRERRRGYKNILIAHQFS